MAETDDYRDFDEVDHDLNQPEDTLPDLDGPPVGPPERVLGPPSLICDDVHVRYRVFGGKRRTVSGPQPGPMRRMLNRTTKHVGAVTEVHAVRGVSFVAHKGESIGIVGRNGAGKSTLLRAIAGLIPLSQGAVYRDGTSSLLGVNAALNSNLSGERNIMLGGLALGLSPAEVRERFDSIVEFSGIGDFVYLPMTAYSSGMSARLRFAISTAAVPDILMIDEALATGDAEFRERSAQKIDEIKDHAGTIFLVSHSTSTIENMCDRAIWIDAGQVKIDGTATEVVAAYTDSIRK